MLKNIALGMILGNDREDLEKYVPRYDSLFDEKFAVDDNVTDGGIDFLVKRGWLRGLCIVAKRGYGELRTALLSAPITKPWLLMLDADETMNPIDLVALDSIVSQMPPEVCLIKLPRYNFTPAGWFHTGYPDLQSRLVRLNSGVTFSGVIHEQAVKGDTIIPGIACAQHIYHYGYCRDPRKIYLRHHNYQRLAAGQEPLDTVTYPDDVDTYISRHPVTPYEA